ncbi:MAG TPA: cation-translocating P-type ATPase [Verrucomicrobiae bacterium]|nr:cation-translocating P-type ATPase [Verrucomicrobiae bacterium]
MNAGLPKNPPLKNSASSAVSELRVDGMTCNNCARHVTEAIQSVPGVRHATVSLAANQASVRWQTAREDVPAVVQAIKAAGYDAKPIQAAAHGHHGPERSDWHLNLWLGGIVTGALMLGEWVFQVSMERWYQWLAFVLAGGVQIFCGAQFYRGAWRQLKIGSSNMDTLVALGSTTAFGYSTWALLAGGPGHLYFMEAAAIITLISVGHWIEARVSERASGALKSLLELAPSTARRLEVPTADSHSKGAFDLRSARFTATSASARTEREVPVAELRMGDYIALRPGDRIPVDAVVTEGDSAVDESMLTGESKAVDKSLDAEVYAGTVNLNGRLVARVTKTGEATALANIIAAVQRAQTSRANIQRLGDRVSNVFVPIVVAIALAAGLWWGLAPGSAERVFNTLSPYLWPAHPPGGAAAGFIIAAAVLIIACPCAMGLATPAAIMASANTAAKRGILIRDGLALEKAGNITAIAFDKTGTLTLGKPQLVAAEAITPAATALAARLAKNSTHPISQAIAKAADTDLFVSEWQEVRGAGVKATHEGKVLRLGSLRWLGENGVALNAAEPFVTKWSTQGATVVGLAAGTSLAGLFAVRDTIKSNAAQVVQQLRGRGLGIYLVTGDNKPTAVSIAREVGIPPENVFAEVRPEDKAEFLKRLQARSERVAFVGDGINDAPGLTQADLGIAVSRASDVAREAADIILLKSEIEAVPEALGLAQATLRTIKQNLFWAFFYNALGIPLAALGFMSPVLCAAAMGVSDIIVIGNALRLRRWRLT